MEEQEPISILFFKGPNCAPCKVVERHLDSIVKSSAAVKLTVINTEEETELVDRYSVTNVPEVYYNENKVMSAQTASELLAIGGLEQNLMEESDTSAMNMFSGGQNAIFNHLFSELIQEGIKSAELRRQDWKKYSMFLLMNQDMMRDDQPVRESVGDYVHIGILQSIILTILSLSPDSGEYLYEAGKILGISGIPQKRFLHGNPNLLDMSESTNKQRLTRAVKALEKHFSADAYGLPLNVASRAKGRIITSKKASLRVYDSVYAAGMTDVGIPVCYLGAGEIAGLLETTLGQYIQVTETKCNGLGEEYCEFEIEIVDEPTDTKPKSKDEVKASADFSLERKETFKEAMRQITTNMYNSALIRKRIRPSGDYVHISVFQHALTSIKFTDPFYGTLLYYAGLYHGREGIDFAVIDRLAKRNGLELPIEFEDGCHLLGAFFNDPSTILTRLQGTVDVKIEDDETAYFKVYESAISTNLLLQADDSVFPTTKEVRLGDYMAGFITGRLEKMVDWEVKVTQTHCQSKGDAFDQYKAELN
jgi:predicted hydrocarbon binding protein/glutaredoxin